MNISFPKDTKFWAYRPVSYSGKVEVKGRDLDG